jgi:aryl-alcohol dehydrogenase-like predicted oxidoreductase
MEMRNFGRSGLEVSILGFGCGAVGGLMVRGNPTDQARAIARALDVGVNYFDTAVQYGNGESERNLGRLIKQRRNQAIVGTKVRLQATEFGSMGPAIRRSLEGSLQRLGTDRVDIFHLHNEITVPGGGGSLSAKQVLNEVLPALARLREQGLARFLGITAIGDTAALQEVIDARVFDSAQVVYNLLNPSAATPVSANFPGQDYGGILEHARGSGVGVVGIRVLAGGALSGSAERHPTASPAPAPIGSAFTYDADVARAQRLKPLVTEGYAATLTEAATRFAITHPAMSTILIGMATPEQFEQALAAVEKGPLAPAALDRLAALQRTFLGEGR